MEKNNKKNTFLILTIIATIILGIMAVVVALKLYQIGQKPVAPSVPESKPKAVVPACRLSFTISVGVTPTNTPTPTGTIAITPTQTPTLTPTPTVTGGPTDTPTLTPTPTPTTPPGEPTNTPGPTATPGGPTNTPRPTNTPGPTSTTRPTAEPTQPVTGLKLPTALGFLGGLILFSIGLALIF